MSCRCNHGEDELIPELEGYFQRSMGSEHRKRARAGPVPRRALPSAWIPDIELELEGSQGFEEEVSRGSGEYVRWVQTALNRILSARLLEDGISGSLTRSAVAQFQVRAGLPGDGIVGPQTEAALIQAGAGNPPGYGPAPIGGYAPQPTSPGAPAAPDIVNAGGIQVARQIAGNVGALVSAAAADGVRLGGGGYRSSAQQIALRRKNCGTTDYDIWQKPSSQCKTPTARPGQSNHERGLAIDFTYNGASIKSHDNPGFVWLQANAGRFGLKNLPSEAWHWSVDGR